MKNQTISALGGIKFNITMESFRYLWRRARENTESSISVLYFGYYKLATSSELLSEVQAILFHICSTFGLYTPLWLVDLQVILLKEVNS